MNICCCIAFNYLLVFIMYLWYFCYLTNTYVNLARCRYLHLHASGVAFSAILFTSYSYIYAHLRPNFMLYTYLHSFEKQLRIHGKGRNFYYSLIFWKAISRHMLPFKKHFSCHFQHPCILAKHFTTYPIHILTINKCFTSFRHKETIMVQCLPNAGPTGSPT